MPRYNKCKHCGNECDYRAVSCQPCNNSVTPPRKGTAKDPYLLKSKYVTVNVGGETKYKHRLLMEEHLGRKLESKRRRSAVLPRQ